MRLAKYVQNVRGAFGEVYSKKMNFLYTGVFSVGFYALNIAFKNRNILSQDFSFGLLYQLIIGGHQTFSTGPLVTTIIMSVLSAILILFSVVLIRRQLAMGAAAGSGAFIAMVAPACPSCAVGVLGVVGLGGGVGILPLGGFEINLLAVIVMALFLVYLCGKIVTKTCSLKPHKKQQKK